MQRLFVLCLCLLLMACAVTPLPKSKINGVSFVAYKQPVDSTHVQPVLKINANAAAVMPFGFIRDINQPQIIYNTKRQWYGETKAGAKQYITELQDVGISVMLKPQLWIWNGEYTGNLAMRSEADWKELEASYSAFILDFAVLAEDMAVAVFCIGTELELFIKKRPNYWVQLIAQIRDVYSGKLTYAANWDEYQRTPFWPALDYIGIDAYFPISDERSPTLEDCLQGWKVWKTALAESAAKWDRPILFTEFGYRSVDYTAKEPWRYDRSMTSVNLDAQNQATEALFQAFWNESWFEGGYLWKWFIHHNEVGGVNNNQFTPQNKPVEKIIARYYKTTRSSSDSNK